MSQFSKKRWHSFGEMKVVLESTHSFGDSRKEVTIADTLNLIKQIERSATTSDFFDCTCRLSEIFESLDEESINEVYSKTNIYVSVLNAVFRNESFASALINVLNQDRQIGILKTDNELLKSLVFLNTATSLAFFGIAINHHLITDLSIEFLRKNSTDLIKNILRRELNKPIDFVSACSFLEKIVWDNDLHYTNNFKSHSVKGLKVEFLFNNLKTSRSLAGIAITSLAIRPAIESCFKKTISMLGAENFRLSVAMHAIFSLANGFDAKIKHYYDHAPKDISMFFDVFIKNNEKNLIFCLKLLCSGFHFQGKSRKFFDITLDKISTAYSTKQELIKYARKHFMAFNESIGNDDDEWTNKLFLISLKTLSILEEVNNAKDSKWAVRVALYEFHQWLTEVHEVLNKYYIEDDWERIKDYVIKESEIVEWKGSFYTPLEQVYIDESTDSSIRKRLFEKITKVVLSMLNTDGGVLVVGLVENPDAVKRLDAKDHLIRKNGVAFFDIDYELKKHGKNIDYVRLQIIDELRKVTDSSQDKFNNLIEVDPVMLRDDLQVVTVVKILIKKSEKPFFNIKKDGALVWASLTRRAQGQNVDVDIRKYI